MGDIKSLDNINKDIFFCYLKMVDIEFIGQLVDSMSEAVLQLEKAVLEKEVDKVNRLRVFIFDLYNQVSSIIGGQNV